MNGENEHENPVKSLQTFAGWSDGRSLAANLQPLQRLRGKSTV
jgi:hypothetical protein